MSHASLAFRPIAEAMRVLQKHVDEEWTQDGCFVCDAYAALNVAYQNLEFAEYGK